MPILFRPLIAVGLSLAVAGAALAATQHAPTLAQALADPARAEQRGFDERRHPAELVALADLKPGSRVLDLVPGNGYWTRIFSRLVGPTGRVYAVWPKAYGDLAASDVKETQGLKRRYPNVRTLVQPSVTLSSPEPLDVIWTAQNFHDYNDKFMGAPGSPALANAAFRILKPGGLFIVIDHDAAAGRGAQDSDTLHRIERSTVVDQAKAVGFVLVGESAILKNPADPLTNKVFDPSIRGHTSQFALKFRKPKG